MTQNVMIVSILLHLLSHAENGLDREFRGAHREVHVFSNLCAGGAIFSFYANETEMGKVVD